MNCANHPELEATAFCRSCEKPMCGECQKPALGSVYCEEHVPVIVTPVTPATPAPPAGLNPPPLPSSFANSPYAAAGSASSSPAYTAPSPYTTPVYSSTAPVADPAVHPVLALILGFIPGVGAIYNGQYAKGLVHAVVFGLLVSVASGTRSGGMAGFLGIMIGIWVIYQAFEAYHTARKRRYGIAVEEFSSLFEVKQSHGRFPLGAILLIGVGFLLLLDTTDLIQLEQFERYWPLGLIGLGLYLLYVRLNPAGSGASASEGGRQ
jgi:TM2 domain-containing membrane protein YozV